MEEPLANIDATGSWLASILGLFLLYGGILAALILWRLHRRYPPDRHALATAITARSWSTSELGLVLAAILLLYLLTSLVSSVFSSSHVVGIVLAGILICPATLATIDRINRKRGSSWADGFGLDIRRTKNLLLSPAFYLASAPFLIFAAAAWHLLLERAFDMEIELQKTMRLITQASSWIKFLYILAATLVAPFFEELVFRGLLFPYLAKRTGLAGGTMLVSALFALMHMHIPSLAPIFLLSAMLCLAYWRTGSLWASIGMHAIFNAVSILALTMQG